MERLTERLTEASQALATLQALLSPRNDIERDAAILRFSYTFEAVWKAARQYLADIEQDDVASPGSTIRRCRAHGILSDVQADAAMNVAKDRNFIVHIYREGLAKELAARLPLHAALMATWLAALRARVTA